MRLSKIAGLCRQKKCIALLNEYGANGETTQWLGDSDGMYLLTGLPAVTIDNVCTMFDITEKQKEKIAILTDYETGLCFYDSISDEVQITSDYTIAYEVCGMTLLPLMTDEGIVFIKKKYLEPISADISELTFWVRHDGYGFTSIAVKRGTFLEAVLTPDDTNYSDMARELSEIAVACRKKAASEV